MSYATDFRAVATFAGVIGERHKAKRASPVTTYWTRAHFLLDRCSLLC